MVPPHPRSIGFSTGDVEASAGFFVNALGFERHGDALILEGGPYGELVGLPVHASSFCA